MKIRNLFAALAIFGGVLAASPVLEGDADFTIINKTGYPIRAVHIAPAASKNWGPDRLGDGILGNGKSRLIKFPSKAKCDQALLITFDDDGSDVEWEEFNLCEINTITLKYNRKTGEVLADHD